MRPDTKAQTIRAYLSELAYQKGPHARLPTIRELCESFTTSRVTLDEVLYALEQQNVIYRKQGSGIFVSPRVFHKSICILLNTSYLSAAGASPFWGILWGTLAQEARLRAQQKHEYHHFHMILEAPDQEPVLPEDVMTMIQDGRVHAVLSIALNEPASGWLREQALPCISFGAYSEYMVALDNKTLVDLAVQKLAEQGCRKIGLWATCRYNGSSGQVNQTDWHENPSYPAALARHQLAFRPGLIRDYISPPLVSTRSGPLPHQEQGYLVAMDVFGDPDTSKPDGIFIADDMMTDGALAAFHALGVQVGRDVKIVTHGNTGSMMSFNHIPGLTVVEFDPREITLALFELLDVAFLEQTSEHRQINIQPRFREIHV